MKIFIMSQALVTQIILPLRRTLQLLNFLSAFIVQLQAAQTYSQVACRHQLHRKKYGS